MIQKKNAGRLKKRTRAREPNWLDSMPSMPKRDMTVRICILVAAALLEMSTACGSECQFERSRLWPPGERNFECPPPPPRARERIYIVLF